MFNHFQRDDLPHYNAWIVLNRDSRRVIRPIPRRLQYGRDALRSNTLSSDLAILVPDTKGVSVGYFVKIEVGNPRDFYG
jgi:hypothetical protein